MLVALVGGTSFLATEFAVRLISLGHEVICYSRKEPSYECVFIAWELGDIPEVPTNCDAVFYFAWDRSTPSKDNQSVSGTRIAMETFRDRGVSRSWFISSFSASSESRSVYGRDKWRAERHALELEVAIARPGLVIGSGGLFKTITRVANLTRLVILPSDNGSRIPIVQPEDLSLRLTELMSEEHTPIVSAIYEPEFVSLRQLVGIARGPCASRVYFVTIPHIVFSVILRLAEVLRLPVGGLSDSFKSLSAPQFREPMFDVK